MRVSPHTHPESPLSGSTLATLIKQAGELGRTHFAYTDNGHMSSAMKAYNQTKKAGLKFIPGIEVYFKDSTCDIVAGTPADRCKYFTLSIYCKDQEAYQELCRVVSREDLPTIDVNDERQSLWGWTELAQMAKVNAEVVLGGPHCIVGKTMLAGQPALAERVLKKLQLLFGQNLSLAVVCEPWTKKYSQVI